MPFTLFFFAASLAALRRLAIYDGLRRFLLRHGWSILSAHRHKKRRLLRFGNSRPMGQIFSLWGVVCLVVAIGRNYAQD